MSATQSRRTQQQRSQSTQQEILEATLDAIDELGYQRASTPEIVQRAGVSRGALLHHYPTKLDLLAAAFSYAHEKIIDDVARLMTQTREEGQVWSDVLDEIWARLFRGRLWNVTLELAVAARSDEALAERLDPTLHSYRADIDKVWSRYFLEDPSGETSAADADQKRLLNLTFCVLRGIALQTVLREDPQFYTDMMEVWKMILKKELVR